MSHLRRGAVLGTALATIAAGLLTGSTTSATAAARGDAAAATVDVFVQRNNIVRMDTTLTAGLKRFVVRSAGEAGLQLIRPAAGYTKAEAVQDLVNGLFRGRMRAMKRFERNTTFYGGVYSDVEKPARMWVNLPAGTYWAIDTNDETPTAREVRTFRVSGAGSSASPSADAVIRAVGSMDWAKSPRAIPARGKLTFRNDSIQDHHLIMARLTRGTTMAEFTEWVESGMDSPPPVHMNGGFDTGVISPGIEMTTRYALRPGRYVMVCFWPDTTMDGMPHIMMGMYRGIRVG